MEIKTILGSWEKHEKFDRKVNRALAAGRYDDGALDPEAWPDPYKGSEK